MAPEEMSERFTMRLNPDEKLMLQALAERESRKSSDYLRLLVRQQFHQAFPGARPREALKQVRQQR